MDTRTPTHSTTGNLLLSGCILLAQLDLTGLIDYALKAVIGGAIWLAFKIAADWMERRKMLRGRGHLMERQGAQV